MVLKAQHILVVLDIHDLGLTLQGLPDFAHFISVRCVYLDGVLVLVVVLIEGIAFLLVEVFDEVWVAGDGCG